MSPSHANKKGVRYRYYVSQAILQNPSLWPRREEPHGLTGTVPRWRRAIVGFWR
jgi:hypothetical protein